MSRTFKKAVVLRQPKELVVARFSLKAGAQTTAKGKRGYNRNKTKAQTRKGRRDE